MKRILITTIFLLSTAIAAETFKINEGNLKNLESIKKLIPLKERSFYKKDCPDVFFNEFDIVVYDIEVKLKNRNNLFFRDCTPDFAPNDSKVLSDLIAIKNGKEFSKSCIKKKTCQHGICIEDYGRMRFKKEILGTHENGRVIFQESKTIDETLCL